MTDLGKLLFCVHFGGPTKPWQPLDHLSCFCFVEDRIISEEYKIWKRNVPFMYDFMMTRAVEWPSPTVQWFPEVETVSDEIRGETKVQRILLGTNTQIAKNYLTIASVTLPVYVDREQPDLYNMREDEFGAFALYAGMLAFHFLEMYFDNNMHTFFNFDQISITMPLRFHTMALSRRPAICPIRRISLRQKVTMTYSFTILPKQSRLKMKN